MKHTLKMKNGIVDCDGIRFYSLTDAFIYLEKCRNNEKGKEPEND